MMTYLDTLGRYMVSMPAGGLNSHSAASRPATDAEIGAFHRQQVAAAQAVLDAARLAHDEHFKQGVIIGAPPPPGPLDRNSVVAQGVGSPGPTDPAHQLGQPLGGHTEQQGQPTQPVDAGQRPPSPPARTMSPEEMAKQEESNRPTPFGGVGLPGLIGAPVPVTGQPNIPNPSIPHPVP